MSTYLVNRITSAAEHRGALPHRGRRRAAATASRAADAAPTGTPATTEEVEAELAVRLHRRVARTDWLGDEVARDEHGFVLTGPDLLAARRALAARATAVRARDERAGRFRRR